MAEYKICFSVAGAFGAQISFEAKPGVSYEDAAALTAVRKWTEVLAMAEYIKRETAVKAANEWVSEACMAPVMRVSRLLDKLQKVPAADVAPVVHGHRVDNGGSYARCSQCDGVLPLCANYCPNCGAIMDGNADG